MRIPVFRTTLDNAHEDKLVADGSFFIEDGKKSTRGDIFGAWISKRETCPYITYNPEEGSIALFFSDSLFATYREDIEDLTSQIFDMYYLIPKIKELAVPVYHDGKYSGAYVDMKDVRHLEVPVDSDMRIDITDNPVVITISDKGKPVYQKQTSYPVLYWSNLPSIWQDFIINKVVSSLEENEVLYITEYGNRNLEAYGLNVETQTPRLIQKLSKDYRENILEKAQNAIFYSSKSLPISGVNMGTLTAFVGDSYGRITNETVEVSRESCTDGPFPSSEIMLEGILTLMDLGAENGVVVTGNQGIIDNGTER